MSLNKSYKHFQKKESKEVLRSLQNMTFQKRSHPKPMTLFRSELGWMVKSNFGKTVKPLAKFQKSWQSNLLVISS